MRHGCLNMGLRFGGMFDDRFITNLLLSLAMKEFAKSISISVIVSAFLTRVVGDVYECVTSWNNYDKSFVVVRQQQHYRRESYDDVPSLTCLVRQLSCVFC